ncbi:hypothetical protein [Polaromonas sp.]|uniref:hypothetical protein n=1 Tax=Polaromonas sp. TaxID=1869339 RepID=UPI00352B95CF
MKNFVALHWDGKLSLPKSYWLVGVLFTHILIAVLSLALLVLTLATTGWLKQVFPAVLISVVLAILVWSVVGVWRSATGVSWSVFSLNRLASTLTGLFTQGA